MYICICSLIIEKQPFNGWMNATVVLKLTLDLWKKGWLQLLFEKANTLNKKGIQLFPRLNTEKKIFSGSTFSWRGRGGRGIVFASGREITVKNKEKSGLVIIKNGISIFGHLLKNFLLVFNTCQVFGTLKAFKISKCCTVIRKCQSIFILHSF